MHTRITAAAIAAAGALLALTACSSDEDTKAAHGPSTTAATVAASPSASVDWDAINKANGFPAEPVGADRVALLNALRAIDPALVVKPDKAISNARNQCQAITTGAGRLDWSASQRFSTASHPVDEATGALINQALTKTLCPKH